MKALITEIKTLNWISEKLQKKPGLTGTWSTQEVTKHCFLFAAVEVMLHVMFVTYQKIATKSTGS
jgi:hypothetical protein